MKNKNMKKLVVSFGLLALAGAMAGTSTFAWFSMNKKVAATGMSINAKSEQTLVIGLDYNVGTATSVTFSNGDKTLIPSTHDSYATYSTGLKYLKDGTVDPQTGMISGSATYEVAENATGKDYYEDYVVYIAARGGEITGNKLVLSFDQSTIDTMLGSSYLGVRAVNKAITLDVYCDVVSSGTATFTPSTSNYKGKIFLGEIQPNLTLPELAIYEDDIPQVGGGATGDVIRVTMRAYVDGAQAMKESYLKADVKDEANLISGVYSATDTYYTYNASTKQFTQVSTNVETDFATYYKAASNLAGKYYVATDGSTTAVNTALVTFGVQFNCVAA